ncbi:albumin-binding GA domain-containing protein [uncultured Anaerococcus sp.]|uniref:albumin-binding GA domain-containing protein n=1 Tax=uncultured Anaerococcus sp. TaxID=293428 RepID=UPI00280B8078|nr:albumin-binding GA domain-containing protein [uncultured Anaerococcus sp.]MDU5150074.1 albumin-binding GA domain-containing protein [Anaerococcus prevotii]
MKKRNALALALAAGLVLGGANTAFAEGYEDDYQSSWEQASKEQDEKIAKEKELAAAKEAAKAQLREAGITSDFYFNLVDGAKTKEGLDALVAETKESHKASNPEVTPEEPKETEEESTGEWNGYDDEYHRKWKEASEEQDEKLAKEKELAAAKEAAIAAIKEAGVTSDYYVNLINKGKTVEGVNALRDQIIKAHEDSKEDEGPKVTIDEWLLKEAKKEAIEELKKAGITGQIYFDQINKAKTVEGVEALKAEILKAHKGSEEKPGEDDKKPGEDDKKPGEDDKKPGKDDEKPGYATREEAEKAAKEALKNNKTKDSYTIFIDADGRYGYYLWSKADEEEAEKAAKLAKETEKKEKEMAKEANAPKANPNAAPKTGVAGISAVAGLAAVSVAGIIATRKKED